MARIKRTPEYIKEYRKQWRANNREKMRVYAQTYRDAHKDKDAHLMANYGINLAQKIAMWESQEGKCAVCTLPMPSVFGRDCCVDHDHTTGKVRSLLHLYCNVMVGVLETKPLLWSQIESYVKAHS